MFVHTYLDVLRELAWLSLTSNIKEFFFVQFPSFDQSSTIKIYT